MNSMFMRFFRRIVVLFLTLALIPAMLWLPAENVLLKPEQYVRALDQQALSARIPVWVSGVVSGQAGVTSGPATIGNPLNQDTYSLLYNSLVPSGWSDAQAESIAAQVLTQLDLQTPEPFLKVDLTLLKAHLAGISQPDLARQIMSGWPPCNAETMQMIAGLMLTGGNLADIPVCQPPEMFMDAAQQALIGSIQQFSAVLPNEVVLVAGAESGAVFPLQEAQIRAWQRLGTIFRVGKAALPLSAFAAALLLVFLVLITFRQPAEMLRSIGRAFFASGAVVFGLAISFFLGASVVTEVVIRLGRGLIADWIATPFAEILQPVIQRFSLQTSLISAGFVALAVVLLFLSQRKTIKQSRI